MPTGNDLSDIRYENIVLRDKNSDLENENEELYYKLSSKWCSWWEKFMQWIIVWFMIWTIMMVYAMK